MSRFILPLSDPSADLSTVGGKGMSLAKLAQAELPVPDGFHITTEAYRCFVTANALQPALLQALESVDAAQPASAEAASQAIGRLFAQASIPADLADEIRSACQALAVRAGTQSTQPALPLAVRSSATAEDLPDASFAGQQDTYLNIRGVEAVLAAVQKCWASLWTGRAIAYRLRQGIAPESVTLAVVVQQLVLAEAAGILFTANPLTNQRGEAVINAAWGLGEAIVGGAVNPDTITVNVAQGQITRRETSQKQVMTVRTEQGTQEQPVPAGLKNKAVLSDAQAVELAQMGKRIEGLYNQPMDIEWTLACGRFAIVQARPITTLGEPPLEWKPATPKGVYMRGSLVDLLPNPVSPLFATLGIPVFGTQMGQITKFFTRTEPNFPDPYFTTINTYAYMNAAFSGRGWLWVVFGMLPAYPRMVRMSVPFWREQARPQYRQAAADMQQKDLQHMPSAELWQGAGEMMNAVGHYTATLMFATMGASAGSEKLLSNVYDKLARRPGDPEATVLLMGWDTIPLQAEKSLFDLAGFCRMREGLTQHLLNTPTSELVHQLVSETIPAGIPAENWLEFSRRFHGHLEEFGHLIFELDFARELPRDHPEPMLEAVKMYLRGEGANPYERQKTSQEQRMRTAETVLSRLKGLRRWAFQKTLHWAQSLAAIREDALADIGLGYPVLRHILQILGERLAQAGALPAAEDIYWLEKGEVEQGLAELEEGHAPQPLQERIAQRQAFYQKARQSVPPPMLPARKKYMGFDTTIWLAETEGNQTGSTLKGVPTSQGQVTARACVLRGPEDFEHMRRGDVLVAGTTTPAWTPLFAMASAVVTDIGGPLSHGSIVAREYGIPAVMGTGVATRRIRDGQIITVDGGAGTVTLS